MADPLQLGRVRDLLARPAVSLLIDRWDEDWRRLAWVRLDGSARVLGPTRPDAADAAEHELAVAGLRARYPQYRDPRPGRPAAHPGGRGPRRGGTDRRPLRVCAFFVWTASEQDGVGPDRRVRADDVGQRRVVGDTHDGGRAELAHPTSSHPRSHQDSPPCASLPRPRDGTYPERAAFARIGPAGVAPMGQLPREGQGRWLDCRRHGRERSGRCALPALRCAPAGWLAVVHVVLHRSAARPRAGRGEGAELRRSSGAID